MHSLNVFLQDVGSGKSVSCIVRENTIPSICILKRLPISIYISDTKAELVLSSPLEVNCDMIITFISLIGQLSH